MAKSAADRLLAALTADDSEQRASLAALVVDHVLDQPVGAFVDREALVDGVVTALTSDNAVRVVDRHLRPGRERWAARWAANGEKPGDFVSDDVRERLHGILAKAPIPASRWAKGAVDPALVRELVAPVLQETLLSFARRLPLPGVGGGSEGGGGGSRSGFGLRSKLKAEVGKRAAGVIEAGKGVLGGLSAEVERQIQAAARDFSESASEQMRRSMNERLRSPEGRALLGRIRRQALDHVLDTPFREFEEDVAAMPLDDLYALLGPIAEHNAERSLFVAGLHDEIDELLEIDGERTGRELLDEAGLLEHVRAQAVAQVDEHSAALFGSDAFAAWVKGVLK